jgi:hypothetical protein
MEESLSHRDGRTTKIIPHCQLMLPHNAVQCYTQHTTSMLSKSPPLGTRSTRGVVLFQCHTHGSPRHRGSCAHETKLTMHVGLSCIQGMVLIACRESLSLHLSPHGQHRWQEDHQHIPFQASYHPSPIIDATTRLTAAIAGVQDTPPQKIEAIQSLCTLLLGKVALLPPPTPSILPTPPPPTTVVNEDEPIILWNPHLAQPALPTHNLNTDDINSNQNTPAIVEDNGNNNSPIPSQRTSPPHHHLICPLQNCPLTINRDYALLI